MSAELESQIQNSTAELEVDPDPLSVMLEIANLVFQPGSLALIAALAAGAGQVASAAIQYREITRKQQSEIRQRLFEIDRALSKGFHSLRVLASLFQQFNYIEYHVSVGGAPIKGFNNAQLMRRTHEDCRSAVKEARDAFMALSALLPGIHAEEIYATIQKLNRLSEPLLGFGKPYGIFLVAASFALTQVDALICNIGKNYDFRRLPYDYPDELIKSLPQLAEYKDMVRF